MSYNIQPTSTANPKRNSENYVHGEINGKTLYQRGDKLDHHGDQKGHAPSKPVGHPAKEIGAKQLARVKDRLGQGHVFLRVITQNVPLKQKKTQTSQVMVRGQGGKGKHCIRVQLRSFFTLF